MDWNGCLEGTFSDLFSKRNLFLLLFFWLSGLAIFVTYGTSPAKFARYPSIPADLPVMGENDTGAFLACRRDPGAGRSPYRVAFDNLHIENGTLGLFRTTAHKVVQIDNLRVTFSPASVPHRSGETGAIQLGDFSSLFAPQRDNGIGGDGLGLFHDLQATGQDASVSIDLADTTAVRIRGLTWEIHRDGVTVFRARCRDARLQSGSSRVILRGHATVMAHGSTLESNCIELDMRNGRIIANARYILTRNGRKHFGVSACFDAGLKVVNATS